MVTIADLLNAPTEMELDGKVYKLRQPTLLEGALFQRWIEQRARESAGRAIDLPEEDRRQLLRDVNADIAAGLYCWEGPVCCQALQTPVGMAKLIAIVLADQGCDEAAAKRLVDQKLRELVAILGADNDPKVVAVVLAKLGLPPDFLSRFSRTRPSTTPPPTSPASAPDNSPPSTPTSGTPAPAGSPS